MTAATRGERGLLAWLFCREKTVDRERKRELLIERERERENCIVERGAASGPASSQGWLLMLALREIEGWLFWLFSRV